MFFQTPHVYIFNMIGNKKKKHNLRYKGVHMAIFRVSREENKFGFPKSFVLYNLIIVSGGVDKALFVITQ